MMRYYAMFSRMALMLSMALCFAMSVSANNFDVLMWMIDDPKDAGGESIAKSATIPVASARVAATKAGSSDVVYLNFYSQDSSGNWVVLDDNDSIKLKTVGGKLKTGGTAVYADLNALGENYQSYSFAIELGNWNRESGDWLLAATSEVWDYKRLFDSGFIADQVAIPDQLRWTGGTYTIPEPTSGLLLVVGASLLALRRRKALLAGHEVV